jgi:type I restriction enzyme S subunit
MKDSGVEWIGEIPKGWETSKVKFVSNINGRIGYRGYTVDDIVGDGEGAITLSPSNIIEDKFDLEKKVFLSWEKYEESPEIKIYEDDILLVKTGSTIGKVCIVPSIFQKMTINPQLVVLKNHKVNSRYLWFFMSSKTYKDQIFSSIAGGSTPTTSQENILNHYILDPPLPEQKQISDYLDEETSKVDQMVDTETKRIDLLKEYRQSLISNVVTGKIDVRDEVIQ